MNTKNIISAVSVLWLSSSQLALAEMKMIDDGQLSNVTGQQGLTIDIDMAIEVGEFMYQDGGSIVMQGLRLGGMDRTTGEVGTKYSAADGIIADADDSPSGYTGSAGGTTGLNNVRVHVDVAGDGTDIGNNGTIYNFNPLDPLNPTPVGIPDNFFRWAWGDAIAVGGPPGSGGGATSCGNNYNCGMVLGDGDLFIHATFTDSDNNETGRPHTIADFGMELDAFKIKASSYVAGDDIVDRSGTATTAQSTTIMSNLRMEGYFGGFDLLLENKGNGFGQYDAVGGYTETGIGDAASKIKVNSFFEVTEMEYTFDIVGVRYEKIAIHNKRGNHDMFDFLSAEDFVASPGYGISDSQGYAQGNTQIFAVKDDVLHVGSGTGGRSDYTDGIAMNTRFQGDMDIGHLSFGDTNISIGKFFYTDMNVLTNHTISAH